MAVVSDQLNIPANMEDKAAEPPKNTPASSHIPFNDAMELPQWRKLSMTVLLAFCTFTVTFSSSIFSASIAVTARHFQTTETVMLLGVSLFVLGFALGPLFWGPLSERFGRRLPLFTGLTVFAIMQIPVALTDSLGGLLACRFISGSAGAAPVALTTACFADFWSPAQRGTAAAIYGVAVYAGPTLGPIVGTFVTYSHLGWRWTAWLPLIMCGVFVPAAYIVVPETYAPVLKSRAARKLGIEVEVQGSGGDFVRKYLFRPALMLVFEPLLDILTLYISIVYGLLYLTFYAFPYAFRERGWTPQIASLSFLSLFIGILISSFGLHMYSKHYYAPRLRARGKIWPEDRLPPIMAGAVLLPTGLFWFAWTSSANISWVPQMISGAFIGAGIMLVFTNGLVYLVDVYTVLAASASSANCTIRSAVAAGLPLAAPKMYSNLGTAWATSVLAFMCVALVPAPYLFYRYGETLRKKSRYATAH